MHTYARPLATTLQPCHDNRMKRTPLRRKTPLRNRKPIQRTTRINPRRKRPRTEEELGHLARIHYLTCCVANTRCNGPIEAHHLTGNKSSNRKASDFETIPLCRAHHCEGGFGVAVHAGVRTWEANHGTQRDLLDITRIMLALVFPEWCEYTGTRKTLDIPQASTLP